ncbi:MAG TPA: hypothetical protein VJP89_22465 [Pyrinomonadaceae bacterium]|nr:hypothetical protein [Pyrinomonadaceae bacterium]
MLKEKIIALLLTLVVASSVLAQIPRRAVSPPTTPAQKPNIVTAPSLYSWQIRPSVVDGYFSSDFPQPVCAYVNGIPKIFIFTNFAYYPSMNLQNQSSAVRVGEITTPADSYQLMPHSLPGSRWEFAATSILKSGNDHTIYIFGGKNASGDLDEVYSYTAAAGFQFVTNIPARLGKAGARAGAVALPANGMIYLFGGAQNGNSVLNQVLEFDPQIGQFTSRTLTMPAAFHGARGMTKAVGTKNYIYLVGAKTTPYGAPNSLIYRFEPQSGQTDTVKDLNNPSADLSIPSGSGYPMITWDPSGNIRIIAASGNGSSGPWTWGNIQAWILTDNYSLPNSTAKLTAAPYNNAARARDMAGVVKCGSSTYLIGGTYGHGPTFQNRGMLVDRLSNNIYGPVQSEIKSTSIF